MSIHRWPIQERPREKLLEQGPSALSSAELLALLLRTGVQGKSALDLARELLHHFGSLQRLLCASFEEFAQLSGIGKAKYAELQAVSELNRRCLLEEMTRQDVMKSSAQTRQYLSSRLGGYGYEVFACLLLNTKNQVIRFIELFRGNVNQTDVHLGEVVKTALKYHAAAVIIAHNHPSGCVKPSQSDIDMTCQLKKALDLVDVRLLDHVVVSVNKAVSFSELGFI